ncbi:MAG: PAS domain-containing protein [Pseudomonadota bacterium]
MPTDGSSTTPTLPLFDEPVLREILGQFFVASFNAILITGSEPGYPILYANPAFCRMTGYTADELRGQSPAIFQGEKSNPRILHRLHEDLQAGRSFHGAAINYRKNGEPYPVEWNITPVRDPTGRITHFISVQKDLSDLRQLMSRFKYTNENFRAFLRDLPLSALPAAPATDLDGRKQQLTEALLDNVRLYNPALRSDEQVALFDENEFFDLSEGFTGVLGEQLEQEFISAEQYALRQPVSADELDELQELLREIQQQLDLLQIGSNKSAALTNIAACLQDVASSIFYMEDFVSLSSVLAELATHTRAHAQAALPDFLVDTYRGLAQDMETWVERIFVSRSAANIHEMDASIISSAKQLLMFLP